MSSQLLSPTPAACSSRRSLRRSALAASASAAPSTSQPGQLLIVGPGVLGRLVGGLWLKGGAGRGVCAQSATEKSWPELRALGFRTRLRADALPSGSEASLRFPYVVFCAPPSGSSDYAGEVAAAAALWDGTGALVFTSSSAVYPDCDGCYVNEETPTLPLGASPRTDALLAAEFATLAAGGTVLRLGGLYTARRGAHSYYLSAAAPIPARADGLLNLLHYADAAGAVAACLAAPREVTAKATFLACDGVPVSRAEMVAAAAASGLFPAAATLQPRFVGASGAPKGKVMSCDATRAALGWTPKKQSFFTFMDHIESEKVL